jgi:flagellar hook-associated protein 3 FlgL
MSVSTKIFSDQMMTRSSAINEEMQLRQTKISTGRAIVDASEQPIKAVMLSAMEERLTQLGGFQRNVDTAQQRLSLSEVALTSVDNIFTRLRERSVQVAGTADPATISAIRIEVMNMREELVGLVNTRTSDGQALFAGYSTDTVPFVQDAAGRVQYRGDGGLHTLAASETTRLPTSLNGGETFMQVKTDDGIVSVFDIVDSFEAALSTSASVTSSLSTEAQDGLSLTFSGDRIPRDVSFTLSGPKSTATISAREVVGGSHERLVLAINDKTDTTGVTASINIGTGRLELTAVDPAENDKIKLSGLQVEGVTLASRVPQFTMSTDGDLPQTMVPEVQTLRSQLDKIEKGGDNMALSLTTVGARMQRADAQEEVLAARSVVIETDVSDFGAADLEKLITEFQTLLVSRDATRQIYSRIVQGSLFDFLK